MRIFVLGVLAALLVSCGSGKKPDEQAFQQSLDSAKLAGEGVDEQVINAI
jgi:hypothetical protein